MVMRRPKPGREERQVHGLIHRFRDWLSAQQAGDCRVLGWGKTTLGATAAFPAAPVTLEEAEGCGLYALCSPISPSVKSGNSIVIAAAIIAAIRLAREEKIEVSSPARNRPGPF